jgi:hypothetical protein
MAITLLKPFNLDTAGNYTFNTLTSNIKTDNLMYANGSPYVFSSNAAGSNTEIQFNNANSFGASNAFTFNNSTNVVTLTGNITTNNANLGNLVTANFLSGTLATGAQPNITSVGTLSSLSVTSNVSAGNILTDNLLYANGVTWSFGSTYSNTNVAAYLPTYTGNVSANYFIGNGSTLTSITGANVTGQVGNALIAGTVYTNAQPNITSLGTLTSVSVTGNASAGNILTDNLLYSNGVAWNLSGAYSNTNVAAYLPTYTGNLTAGNATFTGNATAGNFITSGSGGNITGANVISATTFTATGNISSGNANLGNAVTANFFIGNGSLLTGLPASYSNTNVASYLPTYTGNLLAGNANLGNAVTANFFIGNGSLLTGLPASYSNTNVAAYLPTYTGNFTANSITTTGSSGNISGANYVTANFFVGNGSALSSITGSNVTGQVANALIAGTVYTNAQPNITSLGALASLTVTGNITSGNSNLGNLAVANFFSGNGSLLSSITASNISGQVANALIAGTVYTNAQPNITSTGTLSGLTVVGNINITGNVNATGNLNYSNVNDLVVGDPLIYLGANNTGNLYDLGFVASYNDGTDEHTGFARDASDGVWKLFDGVVAEPTTTIDFANGTYASFKSGAIESIANVTANYFIGNGSTLTNLTGGNVTGQVGNALIAGTVYTNAQPNITSLGTLSALSVTANVSAGNILTDNLLYSNGVAWSFGSTYSNTNVAAYLPTYSGLLSGTLSTQAQPNVTSVGTLTGLTISGNASFTGANTYFGNLSNVKIPGGSANYVIATDGSGNLSWTAMTAGSSANVTVDTFSANGVANSFTLSVTPTSTAYVFVNINGVFQYRSSYSLVGNVITLGSTPSNGSTVEVSSINPGAGGGGGGGNTSVMYSMGLLFGG